MPSSQPVPSRIMGDLVGCKYEPEHVENCLMSADNFSIFVGRIEGQGSTGSVVTWPVDTELPPDCRIKFGIRDGNVAVKIDGTRYEIKSVSDLPGRDRVLRPCDSEVLDSEQRRLYKKFTEFVLSKDVKFTDKFLCINDTLSYGTHPYKIKADRPVPVVLSKFDELTLQHIACVEERKFELVRSTGKHLLHVTSSGDRTLFQYKSQRVVYLGVTGTDMTTGKRWVPEIRDTLENRLRSQYYEAIRRCEMEDEELSMQGGRRSVLPKLRSYPGMEYDGHFDEWNEFLDLFREIAHGWSLPACEGARQLTSNEPCLERHIPGQCLNVTFTMNKHIEKDWDRTLEVESYDSGYGAYTEWIGRRHLWRDTSDVRVCIDVCPGLKTRRMLRRAQDMSPDINGISRLIAASRKYTIAAVCGNRTWMKDYSYFCFLGKGERSGPVVKELALTVGDILPYAFFKKLHNPTITSGDMRYVSGAEMRDGMWHCTKNETMPVDMELEDRIAGTTN